MIEHHRQRMRVAQTIDLVNALEQEQAAARQNHIVLRLIHADLMILDKLGCLRFSQAGGGFVVPADQQALRAHQPGEYDQSEIR